MALGKKRELLYRLRPDIAVIPECSRESMSVCRDEGFDTRWWGKNPHKGLGVLAAKPWALESGSGTATRTPVCEPGDSQQVQPRQNRPRRNQTPQNQNPQNQANENQPRENQPRQKWIAPVRVHGPCDFLLLPVWACPVGTVREHNYVGQIYDAIVRHPLWFAKTLPTVICGDFNSNTIFDPGRKKKSHSSVVRLLAERGLTSVYHEFFSEHHGAETRPTYYFWHREERSFHIDYVFVPHGWMKRVAACVVGAYGQWRPASDHMPVIVDVALDAGEAKARQGPTGANFLGACG
jgi:hypothetical protein